MRLPNTTLLDPVAQVLSPESQPSKIEALFTGGNGAGSSHGDMDVGGGDVSCSVNALAALMMSTAPEASQEGAAALSQGRDVQPALIGRKGCCIVPAHYHVQLHSVEQSEPVAHP